MRTLSDTISKLSALKKPPHHRGASRPSHLSLLHSFGTNPGSLKARIHVPSQPLAGAALVVALHGCTQTAEDYDNGAGWSSLAEEKGFFVLLPEQQRANNPNLCFNWFLSGQAERGRSEALSIRQMIDEMLRKYDIDAARVFVTGLSAGGAMAATMLALYPDIFAGGAMLAGLPHGVANNIPEAFDRMRAHALPSATRLQASLRDASPHEGPWPTVSIWHGTGDATVHVDNADAMVEQWREVHGLINEPSIRRLGLRTIREWSDSDGRRRVTQHIIDGMGHGVPIDTGRVGALGQPGPFMLNVGISSTYEIADGWGLLSYSVIGTGDAGHGHVVDGDQFVQSDVMPPLSRSFGRASSVGPSSTTIGSTIEAALRSAGLMK